MRAVKSTVDLIYFNAGGGHRASALALKAAIDALPGVPYVTLMTDLADHPPRFWIEKELDQHLICGSPRAANQARSAGLPEERIHLTSGMIMRLAFYGVGPKVRATERSRLGLEGHPPTGLVLFGGHGSKSMIDIAKRLPDTPLILACGHNEALAQALGALPARAPRIVLGFTPEIASYMAAADFLIGKPGPGSISEAVQMQLPVIVAANRWTLPQERYNIQWIREGGLGLAIPGFERIASAVDELTRSLESYRDATRQVRNRAAFEVPSS